MTKARDATWVQAWQVYERKKRAWAAGGYDPEKQPRFWWHPRQGATFKIPSGKVTSFVKIKLPPHQAPTLPPIGPRQPRRIGRASSDGGEDGGDADPDPERNCAAGATTSAAHVNRGSGKHDDDDDTPTLGNFAGSRKVVVALPVRDGATCPA
jgi:hypothetical protein